MLRTRYGYPSWGMADSGEHPPGIAELTACSRPHAYLAIDEKDPSREQAVNSGKRTTVPLSIGLWSRDGGTIVPILDVSLIQQLQEGIWSWFPGP